MLWEIYIFQMPLTRLIIANFALCVRPFLAGFISKEFNFDGIFCLRLPYNSLSQFLFLQILQSRQPT